MEDTIKQVIVVRKDLKMRRGKEIAQSAHASIRFLCEIIKEVHSSYEPYEGCVDPYDLMTKETELWINGSFTKVCLQVNSEQELLDVAARAKMAGIDTHLITDSGKTEFNGIPTHTCCAIGPDLSSRIDIITGDLKIY